MSLNAGDLTDTSTCLSKSTCQADSVTTGDHGYGETQPNDLGQSELVHAREDVSPYGGDNDTNTRPDRCQRPELGQDVVGKPTRVDRRKKNNGLGRNLSLLQDRLMTSLSMMESIEFEDIKDSVNMLHSKTPVTLLMELAQCLRLKVNFVETCPQEGPSHAPRFTVVAVMGGRPFTRVKAGNKRDCKNGAAFLAWKTLIQEQQESLKDALKDETPSGETRPKYFALLTHLKYFEVVEKNPLAFTGRRVMAAIIMQRKQKKNKKDIYRVVSLAIGNRCIQTSCLSLDGSAVNDCHAEIIARRAFLRYLSTQLVKTTCKGTDNIFRPSDSKTAKVKLSPSISFHLYVSDAPCGDASLFTKSEEVTEEDKNSTKPLFTSKQQGLLRVKIEAGEGTIPTEKSCVQSLISLQFGGRLRTMTCSDKILKWDVLGLQGALLSHFMDPVYLRSVSIGANYVYGHASRALYYRLSHGEEDVTDLCLPADYQTSNPHLGNADIDCPLQDVEKSSAVCIVWTLGDDQAEVLDGTTGLLMYNRPNKQGDDQNGEKSAEIVDTTERPPPSVVSKRALLNNFLFLCDKLGHHNLRSDTEQYHSLKYMAVQYQTAKRSLYEFIEEQGYGGWVKKPEELEYF